ncbi:MAG: hypothetical protein J6K23_00270 [Bacilli bacterium]|nr:hypothetical protein [Bacilli bacterium]
MFIAHRGLFDDNIKENTIEAFDNAFNNGYEGIEFDVRLTKDKIPVILHDSFLSRVFEVKGLLKNYTYQELLDNKIEIPKFEDVISRYNNKVMIIELKEKIDITKYIKDKRNLYYISSFNYDYISYLNKSVYYKLGVINYILNSGIDYSKIDFIMVLDSIYNKKLFKLKDIEIIIYGVIGNINSYNKELKYIV